MSATPIFDQIAAEFEERGINYDSLVRPLAVAKPSTSTSNTITKTPARMPNLIYVKAIGSQRNESQPPTQE